MKRYLSFFRIRFVHSLQYRAAAYAGVATQVVWGLMEILMYAAFYRENADSFPMGFSQLTSYVWLQQSFFSMFAAYIFDQETLEAIANGNIAYELARPIELYPMWFAKNLSIRCARATLRCVPVLLLSILLPRPYGLSAPAGLPAFLLFLFTLCLAALVLTSVLMFLYILAFYTLHSGGIRMIMASMIEFLTGALIPIPFFPAGLRTVIELSPFAAMQNLPFRVYSGDIAGMGLVKAIALQLFWLIFLVLLGRRAMRSALRRVVVQGG